MNRGFKTINFIVCMALCLMLCLTSCKKKCEHSYEDDNDCSSAVLCTKCEEIMVEAKEHNFTNAKWEYDQIEHWHTCTNDGCNVVENKISHTPNLEHATTSSPKKCTVCEYIMEYPLPTFNLTAATDLIYTGESQPLISEANISDGYFMYSIDNEEWDYNIPTEINAGVYTVYYKIIGYENFSSIDTNSVNVTISPKTVVDPVIFYDVEELYYDGTEIKPNVSSILANGQWLSNGIDYEVISYEDNINIGTNAKVFINFIGNYTGQCTGTFTIKCNPNSELGHIDENHDYQCDYHCGKITVKKEQLQLIIENTLKLSNATIQEKSFATAENKYYYIDETFFYSHNVYTNDKKYIFTEDDVTYLLQQKDNWEKEIYNEEINYTLAYFFNNLIDFTISSDLISNRCWLESCEGRSMLTFKNSLETTVSLSINEDYTAFEAVHIHDENNNIIYEYIITFGKNEEIYNNLEDIKKTIKDYIFNENTNTYLVNSSQNILDAIDNAEISGTVDNPATIKLMNDINVETEVNELGYADYGILIESGNIIIDLNGFQLSALNDASSIIQIGSEWGETYNAVVTIKDSSIDKNGKIVSSYIGIYNQGGTLIFNNGIIEVNNTKGDWLSAGIQQYLGSVTMNGGSILVTSVADSWATHGIGEDGVGGTVTINGGYINVNGPLSQALYLRDTAYINGGTIECNMRHISGTPSQSKIYLGTNEDGIGATFIAGINSWLTLNSLLTEGVGYYDVNGNLIEVSDDVKEILDKGDITIKKIN